MEGICDLCGGSLKPHRDAPAYRDYRYPDVRECGNCSRERSPMLGLPAMMAAKELSSLAEQCRQGSTPGDLVDQIEELARYLLEDAGLELAQHPSSSSSA